MTKITIPSNVAAPLPAAVEPAPNHGFSEAEIAQAIERSKSRHPGFTTQQAIDYLHSLDQR